MKKIVCGPDNAKAFNTQLRERVPAFHALAKELFQSGMISGLAGATLEIAPFDDEGDETATHGKAAEQFCRGCGHFLADQVGDGTGIGACAIDGHKNRLKWPNQNACRQFDEQTNP